MTVGTYASIRSRLAGWVGSSVLPNLEESQYWSLDEQLSFQSECLAAIYRHHYRSTKPYRDLCMEHGLSADSVKGIDDLGKLPIIDRQWVQRHSSVRNRRFSYGQSMRTGGSTGEPLVYAGCRHYHKLRIQAHLRGWGYFGVQDPHDFTVISVGQARLATSRNLGGELDSGNIERVVDGVQSESCHYVRTYPSSAYIVAIYMLQHGITNRAVRAFNLISENIYDYHRKAIGAAFPEAELYEEYCCNDGGASAWECETHSGLHQAIERAIVEPGHSGEMIVTDLWNRAMPFIRYRNGDYLVGRNSEPCECGRRLPRIRVRGRANDIVITPNGPVSPTCLQIWGAGLDFSKGLPSDTGLSQIQYVQSPGYNLTVRLVKGANYTDAELARLKEWVESLCRGMNVSYEFVDRIEPTRAGKRTLIINNDRELVLRWLGAFGDETGFRMPHETPDTDGEVG